MLNKNISHKQQAYTLVWVMLLLMLLTFLSANLHTVYTQKIIFDKSFKFMTNNLHQISHQLSFCENKLLMAYESELEIIANISSEISSDSLLVNSHELDVLEQTQQIEFKTIENNFTNSNSVTNSINLQPPHGFLSLFNVLSISNLHESFYSFAAFNKSAIDSNGFIDGDMQSESQSSGSVVTADTSSSEVLNLVSNEIKVKQCFYYKFSQLTVSKYFEDLGLPHILEILETDGLSEQPVLKAYIYASVFDKKSKQHFLLRSNYILSSQQVIETVDLNRSYLGRQALVNLSAIN